MFLNYTRDFVSFVSASAGQTKMTLNVSGQEPAPWPNISDGPSQFDSPMPFWEKVLEAGVLSAICVTAVVSNVALWFVVLTTRSLRNESNYLILCLSMADLLVSVVSMPITVATIASEGWIFSQ